MGLTHRGQLESFERIALSSVFFFTLLTHVARAMMILLLTLCESVCGRV